MVKSKKCCSFCGRSEDEVRLLITGINGYICDECAESAHRIVLEALSSQKPAEIPDFKTLPKPKEIKDYLDQYVIGQDEAKKTLAVSVYNH